MADVTDTIAIVRESVSTVFRHILPGIVVLLVARCSVPSWFPQCVTDDTASIIILGAIALAIGNVWYVFHRYFVFQAIDWFAYALKAKGQPSRVAEFAYRVDTAKHVRSFFRGLAKNSAMGRHIRDRLSSLNLMYIVSEALIVFAVLSEDNTFLQEHSRPALVVGILGGVAATCQYLMVRTIDEQFCSL
jgi:hypothetical protein